jgi:hypothetical protein
MFCCSRKSTKLASPTVILTNEHFVACGIADREIIDVYSTNASPFKSIDVCFQARRKACRGVNDLVRR